MSNHARAKPQAEPDGHDERRAKSFIWLFVGLQNCGSRFTLSTGLALPRTEIFYACVNAESLTPISYIDRNTHVEKQLKPLRLAKAVKSLLDELESVHTLARNIARANDKEKTGCKISWRKLEKLAKSPESVELTWENLVALDTYLRKVKGEGLDESPILEPVGILNAVAGPTKKVIFLVGAKPRPKDKTCDLSPWDMRSTTQLARDFTLLNSGVPHEIVDVMLGRHTNAASLKGEPWLELFKDPELSIIAIGSPRACLATELMMSEQFGVSAFGTASLAQDLRARLPFHFIWSPRDSREFRSRFALPADQIPSRARELRQAVLADRASAFRLSRRYFKVPSEGDSWKVHGVITAQRRANGQIWLVVSGLTGPATYGAAMKVGDIRDAVPWSPQGENGPVLWAVVEVTVAEERSGPTQGDDRKVKGTRILHGPERW